MVNFLVWFLAGLTAPKIYEKLSPKVKAEWKEKYPGHHGEVGVMMLLSGSVTKNLGLAAFGAGLIIEDWKDKNEWFKKDTDATQEINKSENQEVKELTNQEES